MIRLLRHLVVDDFQLKVLSLALALMFWVTVSFAIRQKEVLPVTIPAQTMEVRSFFNVPVAVVSAASDVHAFTANPGQIEVTVQGEPRFMEPLQAKNIRVLANLTGIDTSRNPRVPLDVSVPANVTLLGIFPREVQIVAPSKPASR